MFLALLVTAGLLCCAYTSPVTKAVSQNVELGGGIRTKRNSRIIEECMLVGLEEGTYYYKSRGTGDVCGVYLISQPDEAIQVSFDYINVDCETDGLVSFVDGWELGGELFPSITDAPLEGRAKEFCGRKKKVFRSTGNAAVIQYRIPRRGDGFKITVRYTKNPSPCNILVDDVSGVYTLRNHGQRSNCTITAIFPASVSLLQMAVGVNSGDLGPNRAIETGVLSRCQKRGARDFVEIGGGHGLDSSKMEVEDSVCGLDSNPRFPTSHILCGMTSVRMVSSGLTDNTITVAITQMSDLDIMPTLMCEPL